MGNYDIVSAWDFQNVACVDRDGFFFQKPVEKKYECCLRGDCSKETEEIQEQCYDPTSGLPGDDKIKPCSFWPT